MRYFMELSYSGKNFHGWQIQPDSPSVQQEIQDKLAQLFQQKIEILGAGRTDTGVHAKQMYAHLDLEEEIITEELQFKLNSMLPAGIAIHDIFQVPEDAHARFDAVSRTYQYQIIRKKDPFESDHSWLVYKELDVAEMNKAASLLKDYENFKCFSRSRTDVKTYNCKITEAFWTQENDQLVFQITANRFLRNMVRAIVGTMVEIGLGKYPAEELKEIIKSENRSRAGASVPAHGLYLTRIVYPEEIRLT